MSIEPIRTIEMDIAGLGIIFYSPRFASHILEGQDYLEAEYWDPHKVEAHVQKGTIVCFSTGTGGTFKLKFFRGYPGAELLAASEYKLRLGLQCSGGVVHFRDLYDLMRWKAECPESQKLFLPDGYYHVTLLSEAPESGVLGDHQEIQIFLQKLSAFPELARMGVPSLCG